MTLGRISNGALFGGRPVIRLGVALLVGALASGIGACSSTLETSSLGSLKVPELPKIELPEGPPPVVGSPTEVYTRVARGALTCWFGSTGPLKETHVFHAEAEPAHKGGRAEIVIHEKDMTAPSPRGLRAFRVGIEPAGETAAITIENLKLPKPIGEAMEKDVRRWGTGGLGCSDAAASAGWGAAAQSDVGSATAPSKSATPAKKASAARR